MAGLLYDGNDSFIRSKEGKVIVGEAVSMHPSCSELDTAGPLQLHIGKFIPSAIIIIIGPISRTLTHIDGCFLYQSVNCPVSAAVQNICLAE